MSDDPLCNHPLSTKDGRCERKPSYPDGKCGYHTAVETDMDEDWKPNYEHGIYVDRGGYYKSLPEPEQQWVDAVADDLIGKSYYEKSDISMLEKCRHIAVDLHKRRRADEYIQKKGMTQQNPAMIHEEYGIIEEEQENVLHVTSDRLSRESRLAMKDLGIMDQEKDATEETKQSLIEKLSEEMDE